MARSFVLENELQDPVDQVWRCLTEPTLMGLWLMNFDQDEGEMTTDFRPVAGAPYRIDPGRGWRGYVAGTVLEVEPKTRLVYTWAHSSFQDAHPTWVEFTLQPTKEGTRLRVTQTGFPGVKGWFAARMGWKRMLDAGLPAVLARHAAKPAR